MHFFTVTLSEKGGILPERFEAAIIDSHFGNIADVSGREIR